MEGCKPTGTFRAFRMYEEDAACSCTLLSYSRDPDDWKRSSTGQIPSATRCCVRAFGYWSTLLWDHLSCDCAQGVLLSSPPDKMPLKPLIRFHLSPGGKTNKRNILGACPGAFCVFSLSSQNNGRRNIFHVILRTLHEGENFENNIPSVGFFINFLQKFSMSRVFGVIM